MVTYNQISYGSKGSDVTELQKLLNNNGYSLDVDGDFGSKTQAAVKDYQQKNNLDVDGIVGNNTWGALTKANTGAATTQSATTANTGFQNSAYQESDTVKQAQALLQQQMASKPGDYTSSWQNQLSDILQQIQNREKFSYDLNGDALYQQYKNQYMLQGQQAMMDTMGQAQAMTGGYGNSYAQSVGQQAYQGHLQQLNDKIPELYQLAMSKYQMEGNEMKDQAALMAQMEDRDYGRYRDQVSDFNAERDRLQNQYDTERDYDYGKWADNRDFSYGQYADDRAYDYQTGRDEIADKQWQAEFDEAVRQWNHANGISNNTASGPSNSGTDSPSTPASPGGRYDSETAALQQKLKEAGYDIAVDGIMGPETQKALDAYNDAGGGGGKLTYSDVALTAAQMRKQGASKNDIYQYISSVINGPDYKPTNSAEQDLAELKSGYVGSGR